MDHNQRRLSQNQFIGLKKYLPLKFHEGASYICVDTEQIYIYNQLEDPVLVASSGTFSAPSRVFLSDTNANPSLSGEPTSLEVENWNESLPQPFRDTIIYYTGDDNESSQERFVFHVDGSGSVTLLSVKGIGPTGLESVEENGKVGSRLVGKNPDHYGDTGSRAVDLSHSSGVSSKRGSLGDDSFTIGIDNENGFISTLMYGQENKDVQGPGSLSAINLLGGAENEFGNHIIGTACFAERGKISRGDAILNDQVAFLSLISGGKNDLYAGHGSAQIGTFILGGASNHTVVGVANVDETVTMAGNSSASIKSTNNPRFTVGVGTYSGSYTSPGTITRKNGLVVWGDGGVRFPELSNNLIDLAGLDSAITKGWALNEISKNLQSEITDIDGNILLSDGDHKRTFFINRTANITITLPSSGLRSNFICFIHNISTGVVTFQTDGGVATVYSPGGLLLNENGKGMVERKLTSNDYYLSGDWAT